MYWVENDASERWFWSPNPVIVEVIAFGGSHVYFQE